MLYKHKAVKLKYKKSNQRRNTMRSIKIGDKLKKLRLSKNLTTQQVADKVNISQSYISRFENDKAIPDVDMLNRILIVLDSDLASFFSENMKLPSDIVELLNTVKTLSPEARIKLNEFLNTVIENEKT